MAQLIATDGDYDDDRGGGPEEEEKEDLLKIVSFEHIVGREGDIILKYKVGFENIVTNI